MGLNVKRENSDESSHESSDDTVENTKPQTQRIKVKIGNVVKLDCNGGIFRGTVVKIIPEQLYLRDTKEVMGATSFPIGPPGEYIAFDRKVINLLECY